MNIELRRIRHKPETIDGHIYIDGVKVCDCAENAHHCLPEGSYQVIIHKCRHHARKMPIVCLDPSTRSGTDLSGRQYSEAVSNPVRSAGITEPLSQTCLEGSTSPPCEHCPSLEHVVNNTSMPVFCPQLCPGNGVYNRIDGSIIVGKHLVPGCLSHPLEAFRSLYERIRKNIERGNPVYIIISSL